MTPARNRTTRAPRGAAHGAWAFAALLALGCSQHKKVTECNALVATVNTGIDKVQKAAGGGTDAGSVSAELRAVAELMDEIGAAAAKVELTLPDLQGYAREYQSIVKEVGAAAREVADAKDKADEAHMQRAQARMDSAVKREDPLVDQINQFCRNP